MRPRLVIPLLSLMLLLPTGLAQAADLSEAVSLDALELGQAGLRYARMLQSRGHPECANVMCHLAFERTEKADVGRERDRLEVIDLQLDILEMAQKLGRRDTAMHLAKRCQKMIDGIEKQVVRRSRQERLDRIKAKAETETKVKRIEHKRH